MRDNKKFEEFKSNIASLDKFEKKDDFNGLVDTLQIMHEKGMFNWIIEFMNEQQEKLEYYQSQNEQKKQAHEEIYHLLNEDYNENWKQARDIADKSSRDYIGL